jgi:hypothetical protein
MSDVQKENAGAAATAPDALETYEAAQLPEINNATLATRHSIIALHWWGRA